MTRFLAGRRGSDDHLLAGRWECGHGTVLQRCLPPREQGHEG